MKRFRFPLLGLLLICVFSATVIWAAYPGTDNFTRANSGTLGANWTATSDNWSISANTAVATTNGVYTISAYSAESFNNDQTTTVTVANAQTTTFLGPCVRLSLVAASGYCVVDRGTSGGNSTVSKFTTGTRADLCTSTNPDPYVNGDTMTLQVVGTTLTYTHNGSTVAGCLAFTDATYASGAPGMIAFNNGTSPTVTLFSADCVPTCAGAAASTIAGPAKIAGPGKVD